MGHQDDLLDAGGDGFAHHILDQRLVDHGQHLLGDGLGGGQHAGTQTGNGENGLRTTSGVFFME
jgi:hypothetical protein